MIALVIYTALSICLVGSYRWLALHYRWLDTPNQRSSHANATPRGAGVIFAVLIIVASAMLVHTQGAPHWSFIIGLPVALIGWWDDLRGTSAKTRFFLYFVNACAGTALVFANQGASLHNGFNISALIYSGISILALLWLMNLYNFMDGINGIAGAEALFVLLAISLFAKNSLYGQMFGSIHFYACAAILGFLFWNFPAGKVFMGDAGSAFLGFFIGILMLWSTQEKGPAAVIWLILLGIFIVDTSYTLLIRFATGQIWYAAHRLHAYQRLTDLLHGSHSRTVCVLMLVNIGWLLPMAWLVHTQKLSMVLGIGIAYLPLIAACRWLRAGIPARGRV